MNDKKTRDYITEIASKWHNGTITPEEKARYEKWYASFNDEELMLESSGIENEELLGAILYAKVKQRIDKDKRHPLTITLWPKWYGIAAVLVLIIGGLLFSYPGFMDRLLNRQQFAVERISPGKNKAVLMFTSGKVIALSDAKSGIVIDATKLSYNDGSIIHNVDLALAKKMAVSTPKGGTYQVILPDGSKVWLNAASSITFPASFDGLPDRRVEVKGEVYFEISKSYQTVKGKKIRRSFVVTANNQQIEVLGTHFNVKNYADESGVSTTLLEGRVKVVCGTNTRIISPGQQLHSIGNRMEVSRVNVDDVVAWKNGNFQFNDENIENVMRAISRWYNVDIVYQGTITKEDFGGTISRSKPITEVLASLEETGAVHFKIEGRRVIVMP